jgi:hypothetical protein
MFVLDPCWTTYQSNIGVPLWKRATTLGVFFLLWIWLCRMVGWVLFGRCLLRILWIKCMVFWSCWRMCVLPRGLYWIVYANDGGERCFNVLVVHWPIEGVGYIWLCVLGLLLLCGGHWCARWVGVVVVSSVCCWLSRWSWFLYLLWPPFQPIVLLQGCFGTLWGNLNNCMPN